MLEWRTQLDPLFCGCLVLGVMVWVHFAYRRLLFRISRRRALVVMLPKVIILLIILIALFEPVVRQEVRKRLEGRILTLVDVSSSMSVPDDGQEPRLARARKIVDRIRSSLPSDIAIDEMAFNTTIFKGGTLTSPDTTSGETDLGACLLSLCERVDISSYLNVILLTDGGDEALSGVVFPDAPLSIIGIGTDPSTWNDVSIVSVEYPRTSEENIDFEVRVNARASTGGAADGFSKRMANLTLVLEEEVEGIWRNVATKNVDLSHNRVLAQFEVSSDKPGLRSYRVSVEPVEGELSPVNNTRSFAVDIRKRSVHILYFTRELGVDFRVLRNELAHDPGVTFTALFRTSSERFTVQGKRLPRDDKLQGGFPRDKEILQLYDCIVIGSFPADEWEPEQMQTLLSYAEDGGAVIFMGGEKSFGKGGYADTLLAPLFPWQITAGEPAVSRGVFAVSIPASSRNHPIMAGAREMIEESKAVIESANQPGRLRPGAVSLLNTIVDGRTVAIIALQPYGKGKVVGVACNTLWRWAKTSEALRTAYGRFWRQAVRNIAEDVEGGQVLSIRWDQDAYRPGERTVADIRAAGWQSEERLILSGSLTVDDKTTPIPVSAVPGLASMYSAELQFRERGDYVFRLMAYQDDAVLESYEKTFRIAPIVAEGSNLEVDEDFLNELARKGSGTFAREEQIDRFVEDLAADLRQETTIVESPLVHTGPYFVIIFLLLLVSEWILRRKQNLV